MNYAIRSGISITAGYAIRQSARLLSTVKGHEREEIATLQQRLESKIRIISPAIDMIELISARGNTTLDSAVNLTKAIRLDIQALGIRLSKAATDEELSIKCSSKAKSNAAAIVELKGIITDMKRLLNRIEDAVPLINLAITTSGVNLSTQLPSSVSPSRLLQASTFLTAGDSRYAMALGNSVQVGPLFVLSLYMLFAGHANRPHDEEGVRETTWKEVIHKARVKLMRVPLDKLYDLPSTPSEEFGKSVNGATAKAEGDYFPPTVPSEGKAYEFAYQLFVIEDLEDDRVHEFEDGQPKPGPFEDVALAGIREVIPIHEISKIFYADTGKILNIGTDGEANNPILLLKRDVNAAPPRRMAGMDDETSENEAGDEDDGREPKSPEETTMKNPARMQRSDPWHLPLDLDPEWLAVEVYTEEPDSDVEEDPTLIDTSSPPAPSRSSSSGGLTSTFTSLNFYNSPPAELQSPNSPKPGGVNQLVPAPGVASPIPIMTPNQPTTLPALRTSLSLLEVLIRLTSLQQFQQASHLTISDELLNFFLSEAATTGAGSDIEHRRRARDNARRRVGFDPYDESPIKRRGEEYIDHYGEAHSSWNEADYGASPYPSQRRSREGTPNLDYRADNRSSVSRLSTPGYVVNSPAPMSSPSPSLRKSVQERSTRTKSAGDVHGHSQRDSGFVGMSTPPLPKGDGAKGRMDALRRDAVSEKRSPLSRSDSDSTLGTSPVLDTEQ